MTRKGFALSSDAPGELQEASGLFKSALSKATEWDRDSLKTRGLGLLLVKVAAVAAMMFVNVCDRVYPLPMM